MGAVDCATETNLCKEQEVKGYPTCKYIFYFLSGLTLFSSGRTYHFRPIRHFRNQKETGTEVLPAIVSGIVTAYVSVSYQGPYNPITPMSVKASLKNRLRLLSLFFAITPRGPVTYRLRKFGFQLKRSLFERTFTNRVLSHFQYAQRFYLSTICRKQFH